MLHQLEDEVKPQAIAQEELADVGQALNDRVNETKNETEPMMTLDELRSTLDGGNEIRLNIEGLRLEFWKSSEGYEYGVKSREGLTFSSTEHWEVLMSDLHEELVDLDFPNGLRDIFILTGVDLEEPSLLSKQPTPALVHEWAARARDGSVEHQALILAHIQLGKDLEFSDDVYELKRFVGGGIAIYSSEECDAPRVCGNGDGSIDGVLEDCDRQHFQDRYKFVAQVFQQL